MGAKDGATAINPNKLDSPQTDLNHPAGRMYVRRVVIENIKSFARLDLDLAPGGRSFAGWTVITGDNGSGKTAFLKAISLAILGPDQRRAILPDVSGWVTKGTDVGTISVEIKPNQKFDKTERGGAQYKDTFWAEVEIISTNDVWDVAATDIFRNKKKGAVNGPWSQYTDGWASLGYGPFRRLYGSSPDAQRLMVLPGRIPRFATLFKEDATLGEGEEWVKELQFRTLEKRDAERHALDQLLLLLGDDFLRNGLSIERVDSEGIWLRDKLNRLMPLSDMSEGYRSALAMLIDIFRHFYLLYGGGDLVTRSAAHRDNDDQPKRYVVNRPGLVLIDEIDVHLHPEWQREVGFWLKEHFPQVQFVVTSHSPLVCQAADNGRIFHMPQPGEGPPFRLSRRDYETIIAGRPTEILLTPAFGMANTRSPIAVRARKRHAQLRAKALSQPGLTRDEEDEIEQLEFFTDHD
jgi:hypothetical protein